MPDILVLSAVVPKALGAKVILDQHDPMPELMATIFSVGEESVAVRVMKQLEKWSLRYADLILTVNIACKRIFANRSCPPGKIGIVMNAPDEKIFGTLQDSIRRTGSDAPFVIMYHGSIVERNGLDLAVEAFARVQANIPLAELRIYGRATPFLDAVMAEVQNRGLHNHVKYMGPKSLEQLVNEIASCDLGIIPNQKNAFTEINTPTRIFEYLSLGKPVVAPRSAGICDYFDDRSMLFFDLGSAEDLARKMEYAFSHPTELLEIVQRGQDVYRRHTWKSEREQLIGLVEGLVCGNADRLSQGIKEQPASEPIGSIEGR
jgi:glycosyltransferase involved in cell wall biosynthesis